LLTNSNFLVLMLMGEHHIYYLFYIYFRSVIFFCSPGPCYSLFIIRFGRVCGLKGSVLINL
jgi:hypothetical protein